VLDPLVWRKGVIITSDLSLTALRTLAGSALLVVPLSLIDEDPTYYVEDLVDSISRMLHHEAAPG
jgi:hypothetical protein